jgi:putative intracellular protease/amidase
MRTEIVLFNGFDDLDATGPFEVLTAAGFDVCLVTAGVVGPVTSAHGMTVTPAGPLGQPELLVVPGGGWLDRAQEGAWAQARRGGLPQALAARAAGGTVMASVCTGAMLLARAGLVAGRPATTHHAAHAELADADAALITGARVVDDGDLVTSGGVTAGLDLALWLVERELGRDAARAREAALEYQRGDVWCSPAGRAWRETRGTSPEPAGERVAAGEPGVPEEADPGAWRELLALLPGTPLARATLDHVRGVAPPFLFNHCVRSYVFASLAAGWDGLSPGRDYDRDLLFAGCLLHDLGVTPGARGDERFEVVGADLAAEFLRGAGAAEPWVQRAWEAIALHTSAGIAERRSAEVALTRIGIRMDFSDGAKDVPDDLAALIHAACPRLAMATALTSAIVAKAHGDPRAAPPYSTPGELLRERSVAPFVSRVELAALRGRWGS